MLMNICPVELMPLEQAFVSAILIMIGTNQLLHGFIANQLAQGEHQILRVSMWLIGEIWKSDWIMLRTMA